MIETETKYIQQTQFQLLENWSVQYLIESSFFYNPIYKLVKIGDFLRRNRNQIEIEDDKFYQRVTVRINNGGVFPRDVELGKNIGTKLQYVVNKGQFLMSKIDARNGAFGIVPKELEGAVVTNDFPVFDVKKEVINPEFLVLITTTKEFVKFAQSCSSGTTNRQRIDVSAFLNVKIPLPTLEEQNQIVEAYNKRIAEAERLEAEAKQLEERIEEYLLNVLELEKTEERISVSGLQFINFERLERWDMLAMDLKILKSLSFSTFKLKKIGEAFSFPKRSWKKESEKETTFQYVELGGVDPVEGIIEVSEVLVKKAPSRATQRIHTGDLLIGTTRPYLKRFAIVNKEYDSCICSSGFCIIEPNERYDLRFLKEFLMSHFGTEQLKNKMTGALYPAITETEFKQILIPFPDFYLQKQIADNAENMRKEAIFRYKKSEILRKQAITEFESKIFMPCN